MTTTTVSPRRGTARDGKFLVFVEPSKERPGFTDLRLVDLPGSSEISLKRAVRDDAADKFLEALLKGEGIAMNEVVWL